VLSIPGDVLHPGNLIVSEEALIDASLVNLVALDGSFGIGSGHVYNDHQSGVFRNLSDALLEIRIGSVRAALGLMAALPAFYRASCSA
jgi:hypothetical protein